MDKPTSRFDADAHAAEMRERGYTVIEDFMDAATLAEVRETLAPYLGSHHGRNDFEGYLTERVYTLVARGKVFEDLTEEPRLLALLDRFLQPGYLLTASQGDQHRARGERPGHPHRRQLLSPATATARNQLHDHRRG
jgi:ectoine hydroxylase-related dioxygenase (phytanoyl-CoA dioxygenase family)